MSNLSEKKSKKRVQCKVCTGFGLVKAEILVCDNCNGSKCMYCNSSGFKQQPYERCEVCYGDGEVDIEVIDEKEYNR